MHIYHFPMTHAYIICVKMEVLNESAKQEKNPSQTIFHQSLFHWNYSSIQFSFVCVVF